MRPPVLWVYVTRPAGRTGSLNLGGIRWLDEARQVERGFGAGFVIRCLAATRPWGRVGCMWPLDHFAKRPAIAKSHEPQRTDITRKPDAMRRLRV